MYEDEEETSSEEEQRGNLLQVQRGLLGNLQLRVQATSGQSNVVQLAPSAHTRANMEIEEEDDDDGDDSNELGGGERILEVLHYLISRSEGLGTTQKTDSDMEEEESSGDEDEGRILASRRPQLSYYGRRKVPRPPANPDTDVLQSSDLYQELLYKSGRFSDPTGYIPGTSTGTFLPMLLHKREIGVTSGRRHLTDGQKFSASRPYLPRSSDPETLLHSPDKFYCGIHNKRGDVFMSGCQDATIRLFDTSDGGFQQYKIIRCGDVGWSILDTQFSHCGSHLIYSSWSDHIHLHNVTPESVDDMRHTPLYLDPIESYRTAVFSMCFTADDSEILAGTNGGYIYVFNLERNKRVMCLDAHEDDLSAVCFAAPHSPILYSGGEDGLIKIWDRRCLSEEDPVPVGQLSGHYDSVTHIDSKDDDRHLISNAKDQSIKLWDLRRLATDCGIDATRRAVASQKWDYRWHQFKEKVVKPKLDGDCSLMTYYGHSVIRTLIRARFSPPQNTGQRYIYCGDGMGRVLIYDIMSGHVECCLRKEAQRHRERDVIRDVSWHPTENHIISSGWDGDLLKWKYEKPLEAGEDCAQSAPRRSPRGSTVLY